MLVYRTKKCIIWEKYHGLKSSFIPYIIIISYCRVTMVNLVEPGRQVLVAVWERKDAQGDLD